MTPLNKVFMLPADARLNQQTMRAILASGHSRIPVYTRGDRCVCVCLGGLGLNARVAHSALAAGLTPGGNTGVTNTLTCVINNMSFNNTGHPSLASSW
jgi:hypothetical protein